MRQLRNITIHDLDKVQDMPLILDLEPPKVPSPRWLEANQTEIERLLHANGALLIRGLKFLGSAQLADGLRAVFKTGLSPYLFRSTPRTHFRRNVYTATEYHASETIPQHNENSYANSCPRWIAFLCVVPPPSGGRTPIADSRLIYQRIPHDVRLRFETRRILYVRNYGSVDLPWTEVFQTDDAAQVERYCNDNGIQYTWTNRGGLETRYIGNAAAVHPTKNVRVWFNQAHLFHITNLSEEHRDRLIPALNGPLPRNAYFGDGGSIDIEDLAAIRKVYDQTMLSFAWKRNDLLLLDNMLFSHGRDPYEGPRKILCGMAGTVNIATE